MYKVNVIAMNPKNRITALNNSKSFKSYKDASNHYASLVEKFNLDNAEPAIDGQHASAGGRAYDYRVDLYVE